MIAAKNMFLVLAIATTLVPHALAHACMTNPPARRAASGPYSVMCNAPAYELSSGNCNGGGGIGCRASHLNADQSVCGGPFQASTFNPRNLPWDGERTYAAGAVIDLSVYYRVSHTGGATPGWLEARLCTNGDSLTQGCFDQHRLIAVGGSGFRHTVSSSTPSSATRTYSFRLPDGVSCERCTLQYIWQTSSWDGATGEQFHNCADITVGGSGGDSGNGGNPDPPAPTPPSSNGGDPNPPPPTPPSNNWRCGVNWSDANSGCGRLCTLDSDCPANEQCYADMIQSCGGGGDPAPPPPTPPSNNWRCGVNWSDANSGCGQSCTLDIDCPANEQCFADMIQSC